MPPKLTIQSHALGYTITRPSGFSFLFYRGMGNAETSACEVIDFLLSEIKVLEDKVSILAAKDAESNP